MKNNPFRIFKYLLLLLVTLSLHANAAASVRLSGHVPSKAIQDAVFLNRLEGSANVPVTFILPLRNQQELAELLERIYDPADQEHFGKYLTTAEFIERFAPTQEDYNKVMVYAKNRGLRINNTHPNRTLLNVSGAAKSIESAFNLQLNQYESMNGQKFYAPNNEPEVPAAIASVITGIVGLDNHAKWRPFHLEREVEAQSNVASSSFPSGPNGGFSPSDIVRAYNLSGISANGSNQNIALFELAGYQTSDINAYTNHFGLPAAKLTNIIVDGGSSDGNNAEVALDIELALALAPASQIYVYEGPNNGQGILDTYNRIATDNIAKQVSTSWGLGEDLTSTRHLNAENAIFQQMAAQGQTIYAASGDSGAFDDYRNNRSKALVVDDPAGQPFVVGVGGTHLTVNSATGAYQMESVWNNGLGNGAGGGGVSNFWPIPSWQTKVSTVFSKTHRNVPDVALDSDPRTGYSIFFNGRWTIFGGTSCAAPLWAAFTACVNQALAAAQKPVLGFANPVLYAIANGTAFGMDFHDVTTGNNLFYNAGRGYDNATGWGSLNGANLYASLTGSAAAPLLDILMKHNAPFTKGGVGNYHIIITNTGKTSTSGNVNVAVSLPIGLIFDSFTGSGWTLDQSTLTFTRSDPLGLGLKYPTISLDVDVANNAPFTVIPSTTVSGGGSVSSTVTNLTTCR